MQCQVPWGRGQVRSISAWCELGNSAANPHYIPVLWSSTLEERKAHTCFQCHRIHLGEVIQLMEWGLPTQELLEISLEGCPTLGIRA